MTNHYQTLGVDEQASPDQIKKAYRTLANQHHPDKGGDQSKFKDISVAYENLSDPQKKAEYDQQRMAGPQVRFHTGGWDPFEAAFGQNNPFAGHPFGDMFGRQAGRGRNRDLNIQCQITLLDSFLGKQLEANYKLPSGRAQTVVINVPPGISHSETIRYQGLGDDSVPQAPRGNLNVTIVVLPDPNYTRQNDDVYTRVNISPIDAMIGCRKKVKTLSGQILDLDLRAGIEDGSEFASQGNGFPNVNSGHKGRFVSIVKIQTPAVTDASLVERLKSINNEINKIS